jgi:hypothetical protein
VGLGFGGGREEEGNGEMGEFFFSLFSRGLTWNFFSILAFLNKYLRNRAGKKNSNLTRPIYNKSC